MKRCPAASGAVIAATWALATSRTSTTAKPMSGQPGSSRFISLRTTSPRRAEVGRQHRAEHQARVDRDQLDPLIGRQRLDEVPRGALGDGLALLVRADRGRQLRPVALVVGAAAVARVAVQHRGDRRGQHDAAHPLGDRRPQHPERAVAGRHDQLVGVLGRPRRQRRRHVQHEAAAAARLAPAVVRGQLGLDQRQPVAHRDLGADHAADLVGALERAHGTADAVAGGEQRHDGVLGDEARGAGDEDGGVGGSGLGHELHLDSLGEQRFLIRRTVVS
jgi:hypothetical protein